MEVDSTMTANLHITHEQPPTCVYGGQVCGCVRTLIHCYMRLKWNYFKSGKQWNEEYLPISVGGERGKNKYYAHWHQRHRGHPHPTSPPFAKSLVENIKITIAIITAIITTTIWYGHANICQIGMLFLAHVFWTLIPFHPDFLGWGGCSKLYLARYILSFCYENLSIRETSDLKECTSKQIKTTTFSLAQASSM